MSDETPRGLQVIEGFDVVRLPALMVEGDYYSFKFISIFHAMLSVELPGPFLQFGVYTGRCTRFLQMYVRGDRKLHAFDSFQGLPDDWIGPWKKGSFALAEDKLPKFNEQKITTHKGLFAETLPGFVKDLQEDIAFIHVDCDLYQSTLDVLMGCNEHIVPGTVILFDEYVMDVDGEIDEGEHRALLEWARIKGREFKYLWRTEWVQVCIEITL